MIEKKNAGKISGFFILRMQPKCRFIYKFINRRIVNFNIKQSTMKRNAFYLKPVVCLFGLLVSIMCIAQSKFSLGIKGGISIPNLQSSGNNPVSDGYSSRFGPNFGIVSELDLSNKFSLLAEFNYSSQGGKKNGLQAISAAEFSAFFPEGTPLDFYLYSNYNSEAKLNYLELPIMGKINFPFADNFAFFINLGPYAGYLLNAKEVTSGSSNIYLDKGLTQPLAPAAISFDQTTDIKDQIKKFNFGVQGGVGLNLSVSDKGSVRFTAGGNYGFVHIQKDENDGKNNTGAAIITLTYLVKL